MGVLSRLYSLLRLCPPQTLQFTPRQTLKVPWSRLRQSHLPRLYLLHIPWLDVLELARDAVQKFHSNADDVLELGNDVRGHRFNTVVGR